MSTQNPILITGGTGKTGRRIAERLRKQGKAVRSVSRSTRPSFDWGDQKTWMPVLQDVEAMYIAYYPDLAFPGAAETIGAFADLAVNSGVKKIVVLSGRGEEGARQGEEAVMKSGANWTVLRASFFFQNFTEGIFRDQLLSGTFPFLADHAKEPMIDADDIAEVAAEALTDERHSGELYELTGPELFTFAEAVKEISRQTGRSIQYVPVSGREYESSLQAQGLPAEDAGAIAGLFAMLLDGRNACLTDGVHRVLGRDPRHFTTFVREAVSAGLWAAAVAV